MKDVVLKHIEDIRKAENGFSKQLMRWQNFTIGDEKIHISKFDFNTVKDEEELLSLYERIIRQKYKSM